MSLTTRASSLHPNRRNAAKWVLAIRYLRNKGGVEDLKKARHYLDKLIELMEGKND